MRMGAKSSLVGLLYTTEGQNIWIKKKIHVVRQCFIRSINMITSFRTIKMNLVNYISWLAFNKR